jgi:hypothetical protein
MQYDKDKAKNLIIEGLTFTCQQEGLVQGSRPKAQGKKKQKEPILIIYDNLAPYALNHIWVWKGRLTLTWTQGVSRWNPNE